MLEQIPKKVIQRLGALLYESDKVVGELLPIPQRYEDRLARMLRETRRALRNATGGRA
jgi:hypothetical protein